MKNPPVDVHRALLPGVTVVVPCKGRLSHLEESVPCLLEQRTSHDFVVLVVDYGDPDGCFEWVASQRHPQLSAIRIRDRVDEFNLSRARNCGACVAPHELLAFADADAVFEAGWIDNAVAPIISSETLATIPEWNSPACGICAVRTSAFHEVRGFDESFRGWGHEDIDFVQRVERIGNVGRFDAENVWLIRHSEAMRTSFYADKDWEGTHYRNDAQAARRRGRVNPKGYGTRDFDIFYHAENGAVACETAS